MKPIDVDAFLEILKVSLEKYFNNYKFEFLIKTPKSLKVNVLLK